MRGYYPGESGRDAGAVDPAEAGAPAPGRGRGRRIDWVVGIAVGIILGIVIVIAFLFYSSEETIDGASISGVDTGKPAKESKPVTAPAAKP